MLQRIHRRMAPRARQQPQSEPEPQIDVQRPTRGRLLDMEEYRRRLDAADRDSIVNALWNEMSRLTHEAWCWRDPESIEALEFHIENLKAHVLGDWQG